MCTAPMTYRSMMLLNLIVKAKIQLQILIIK
jgi:hypothetical protein